ncbi:MAG TPA: A/G-specific adenine glycosylase [Bryobacteraceae bacterium]|nr:A/G-specific adenine glycosylase [Bryobacteraceae bacterium]
MKNPVLFRKLLLSWYRRSRRDLPWRRTRDPYRIWISEIMLQQTRVETVVPYYERFLRQFPSLESLAAASDEALLTAWSGLGYYARARNLRKAARVLIGLQRFPRDYNALRALPGIGDYTAAAIASIAFGQPYAALDGNVARVLARLINEAGDVRANGTKRRLQAAARALLDERRPGDFNQAMMELGATICTAREPKCRLCPVASLCDAWRDGRQRELPVRRAAAGKKQMHVELLIIQRRGRVLMRQRPASSPLLAGFWEFPDRDHIAATATEVVGEFRHAITNHDYRVRVTRGTIDRKPPGFHWVRWDNLHSIPLSAASKKAVLCLSRQRSNGFTS